MVGSNPKNKDRTMVTLMQKIVTCMLDGSKGFCRLMSVLANSIY